jgi:thiamine-phosphate pyrophosphorylase
LNFLLPKIYPITDTEISGLSHSEQVKRMIAGGARMIQLRDKSASSRDFYRAAVKALDVAANSGCSIVINDRFDIAYAAGAAGVHLGQDDMPAADVREKAGKDFVIGISTHSVEQVLTALGTPVDYIAIGPIYKTSTKEQPSPTVGIAGILEARAISPIPLVAIGGIDIPDLSQIFEAGADAAAIIGRILHHPEQITEQVRQFNDIAARVS